MIVESGTLYIVGTPIGNLEDITLRALSVLKDVAYVACEDTRVTRKLLTRYDIHTKTLSYHEHNQKESGDSILAKLHQGLSIALATDAGMPCVSDPGQNLVSLCRTEGIPVSVIPGPSACVSAMAISGFYGGRFTFEGFLSTTKKNRKEHLNQLKAEPRIMIFYEAPHKLLSTLTDFILTFGPERKIALCRELTKIHEEVLSGSLLDIHAKFSQSPPKGEYTLVLEGAPEELESVPPLERGVELALSFLANGMKTGDASHMASQLTGASKREIYAKIVENETPAQSARVSQKEK
jgi:16S rRNA (cytidine1402-2'-O)-methyltransferase